MCRQVLVADRTALDREAVVGEEAHIAAQSPGGPRYGQQPGVAVDSYENLILLCRVHHKQVDVQEKHYTVALLLTLKAKHEQWVHERLEDLELPGLNDPIDMPLAMLALTSGEAVWHLVDGSHAYLFNAPPDGQVDAEVVDLADEFLQLCRDYGEIASEVKDRGMTAVREAQRSLQDYVTRLAGFGLLVVGARQKRQVPGYNPPVIFDVAIISVIRPEDYDIEVVEPPNAGSTR